MVVLLMGIHAYIFRTFNSISIEQFIWAIAAGFETFGQFFYAFAMGENSIAIASLIASYSIVSIILSRAFLKEKLTKSQYIVIGAIMIGIIILGIE